MSDLIGQLSTRNEEFRMLWATHDVKFHRTGTKRIHHALVGDLALAFESLDLPSDPGLSLLVYSAEPGSTSAQTLDELRALGAARTRLYCQRSRLRHVLGIANAPGWLVSVSPLTPIRLD